MKLTDEYIFRQPEKYQAILLHLISVVEHVIPEIELVLKYGVPYFVRRKKCFAISLRTPKKDM